jgi:hypothetical protein
MPELFSVLQLLRTVELNLTSRPHLWTVAVGHLNVVVHHRGARRLRAFGVEALTTLATHALLTTAAQLPSWSDVSKGHALQLPLSQAQQFNWADWSSSTSTVSLETAQEILPSPSSPKASFATSADLVIDTSLGTGFQSWLLRPLVELVRSKHDDTREHVVLSLWPLLQVTPQTYDAE